MSLIDLLPSDTIANGVSSVTGAASRHAALNDGSDSSYVTFSELSLDPGKGLVLQVDDFALPSGARPTTISVYVRTGAPGIVRARFDDGSALGPVEHEVTPMFTTPTDFYVVSVSGRKDVWTDANIDNWTITLSANVPIYAARVKLLYGILPVTTVVAPTGTITDRNLPEIDWSVAVDGYTHGTDYEVKIFSSAQYGAGGFNPATSTPTTSTRADWPAGAGTTWTPTVPLANGTYRAYVRIAGGIGSTAGDPLWGAWAYSQFTISLTPPNAPTVTATLDDANGRISIALDDAATGPSTDLFELQRTTDGGTTWQPVRGLSPVLGSHPDPATGGIITPSSGVATVHDYEAPLGSTVQYRARALHDYGGYAASSWATSATVTSTSVQWWLKDPCNPALNLAITIDEMGAVEAPARQGVLQPVGASYPVVISDTRGATTGTVKVWVTTNADRSKLNMLLATGRVLLLDGPVANHWPGRYVAIGNHGSVRAPNKAWVIETSDELAWVEVANPDGHVSAWPA